MKEKYVINELNKAGIEFFNKKGEEQGYSTLSVDTIGRDFVVYSFEGAVGTIESFQGYPEEYPETVEKFTTCKALIAAIKAELCSNEEPEAAEPEKKEVEITESSMQSMIVNLPGRPAAMLAQGLAEIYSVTTSALNQAVSRNKERFPEDFMFQASENETETLKSQSVILHSPRARPWLFTREGANQLSSVLQSDTAVQRSIQIMRAFTAIEQKASAPALPQSLPEALRLAASIEEKRLALVEKVKADAPKVEYADAVEATVGAIKMSIFAKQLNNAGIKTGPNKLFAWLRSEKYLITSDDKMINNNPMQAYVNSGLFVLRQGWYTQQNKLTGLEEKVQCNTTLITGKGQIFITGKLKEKQGGYQQAKPSLPPLSPPLPRNDTWSQKIF